MRTKCLDCLFVKYRQAGSERLPLTVSSFPAAGLGVSLGAGFARSVLGRQRNRHQASVSTPSVMFLPGPATFLLYGSVRARWPCQQGLGSPDSGGILQGLDIPESGGIAFKNAHLQATGAILRRGPIADIKRYKNRPQT